jgi:hypothetical protein
MQEADAVCIAHILKCFTICRILTAKFTQCSLVLDADTMHEVVCSLKEHLQHQDGTDSLQLRLLLFDFVSLNPKFQFYFGVHATKGHVQLYAPFLMLIVVADRCAKF